MKEMKQIKGLPVIENTLVSHITLPETKLKVTVRPYDVGQKKLFTLVAGSSKTDEIVTTLVSVANAVSAIETKDLPLQDFEKIMIESRKLSSGSIIRKEYQCKNPVEIDGVKKTCDTDVTIFIDCKTTTLVTPPNFTRSIPIKGTDFVIQFRFLKASDYLALDVSDINDVFTLCKHLIESIVDTEAGEIYSDWSEDALEQFWNKVPMETVESIFNDYIMAYPTYVTYNKFVCPKCAYTFEQEFRGLFGFFI